MSCTKTLQQTLDDDVGWYIKCNDINKIQLVTNSSWQLIKKNGRNAPTTSPRHLPTTQSDQTPLQAVQSPARSYKTLSSWRDLSPVWKCCTLSGVTWDAWQGYCLQISVVHLFPSMCANTSRVVPPRLSRFTNLHNVLALSLSPVAAIFNEPLKILHDREMDLWI